VAKASEIVGVRWTPLVLRELLCGSRHFNDLRRGVPLMSPSLLSQRLKALEKAGIVERDREESRTTYTLTPAGEELRPLIEGLGAWGQRWARSQLEDDDLDAGLLMWDVRRNVDASHFPERRTVVQVEFSDVPGAEGSYWLVGDRAGVDLCMKDPGFEVDL
jgi:DNA-binding HxlR family transcriptional regulator